MASSLNNCHHVLSLTLYIGQPTGTGPLSVVD